MKIIDLLNIIAKGEMPKRIKYKEIIYNWKENEFGTGYANVNNKGWHDWSFGEDMDTKEKLNEEVELLEDEEIDVQEIEEITETSTIDYSENTKEMISAYQLIHRCEYKINEIIRVVNKMQLDNKIK